jgi:hypothetical protein
VILLPAMLVIHAEGHVSGAVCMLVWAASATVAAAIGVVQAGVLPHWAGARAWLVNNWDLCPRYVAENLSIAGARQLRYTALAVFTGLAAVGDVRAAEVLLGPFLVLAMGVGLVAIPEGMSVVQRWPHRLRTFCLLLGAGEAAAAAIWGLIVIIWLPHGLGDLLLGPIWHAASPLVLPTMLTGMLSCFSVGATVGLHALALARRSLRAQLVWAGGYLIGGVVGALLGGALGTSWGVVAGSFTGAVYFHLQLNRGIAEHPATRPDPGPDEAEGEDMVIDLIDPFPAEVLEIPSLGAAPAAEWLDQPPQHGMPAEATL